MFTLFQLLYNNYFYIKNNYPIKYKIKDLKSGTNIVNNKTSQTIKQEDTPELTDLNNIGLYYCVQEESNSDVLSCKRTYGYIKLGSNLSTKYYSIGYNKNNEEIKPNELSSSTSCSNTETAKLMSDESLCLGGNLKGEFATTNNNTYIINNPGGSVFDSTTNNILIYSDANSYVFQNIVNSKFLIFILISFFLFLFLFILHTFI